MIREGIGERERENMSHEQSYIFGKEMVYICIEQLAIIAIG